jgi:hypothetical protein
MLKYIDKKTATAENRTLNTPFRAQNHGVSCVTLDLTNFIPVGKKNPIRKPMGKIKTTENIILFTIAEVIVFAIT